jgi:hypothetical protein
VDCGLGRLVEVCRSARGGGDEMDDGEEGVVSESSMREGERVPAAIACLVWSERVVKALQVIGT